MAIKAEEILGVRVDFAGREEVLGIIEDWLKTKRQGGLRQVVTAYGEFLVEARRDKEFRQVLKEADLVVADGVSVLAAREYKRRVAGGKAPLGKLFEGVRVGMDVWRGRLGKRVTGVWLFERLIKLAGKRGWRVFLLGGFGETVERLVRKLKKENKDLVIEGDRGRQGREEGRGEEERVAEKINRFGPDLLFVAYGPVKQEKWIGENRGRLGAGVAVGVGGTFDEVLGSFKAAPWWMERRGLKWLWRLFCQPRRIGRIWKGVVVFPWLVYQESFR